MNCELIDRLDAHRDFLSGRINSGFMGVLEQFNACRALEVAKHYADQMPGSSKVP
jgi:hypothetical protein